MTGHYYINEEKNKQFILDWVKDNRNYKPKKWKANVFFAIAAVLASMVAIFGIGGMIADGQFDFFLAMAYLIAGCFAGFIPFLIGVGLRDKLKKEVGFPYNTYERASINIYDDGLEYQYHDSSNSWVESVVLYRIPSENITSVRYDRKHHFLTVVGEGELTTYDDYANKRINYEKSGRRFYSNTPFSFFSAFDNKEEIVNAVKAMTDNVVERETDCDYA